MFVYLFVSLRLLLCLRIVSSYNISLLPNQLNESNDLRGKFNWTADGTTECNIKYLTVLSPSEIHPNIIEHCKSLKTITFDGFGFTCHHRGWKSLKKEAQRQDVTLISAKTSCKRVIHKCYEEDDLDFLKQIECQEKPKNNPSYCMVSRIGLHQLVLNCTGLGLKNEDLPQTFPENTTTIMINNNNQLTDVSSMMENMMSLRKLTVGQFVNNSIRALPTLPDAAGRERTMTLSFSNNSIRTLDIKSLESFLAYKNVRVTLTNNSLKCDCNLANVLDSMRSKLPTLIEDILNIYCEDPHKYRRPWAVDYSHCKGDYEFNIYDLLIALTAIVIVLMSAVLWNLNTAIRRLDRGENDVPMPWIHTFLQFILTRLRAINTFWH